jgi:acyl-CoA synthetase (AMP-forming)/AMP-acid ligase II
LNHVSGFSIAIRSLLSGAAVVFSDSEYEAVTHLSLVPTQLQRLLDSGAPLHRLRAVLVGGGPISSALVERAICAGVPLHLTYGMTESASQICTTERLVETPNPLHAGQPLPGREVRISDAGEIQIRSPILAKKFLGSEGLWEDLADADGWFGTGDLGAFTAEGNLVIQGRRDRLIISGGENISSLEVEDVLYRHPAVIAAAAGVRVDGHEDNGGVALRVDFALGDAAFAALYPRAACAVGGGALAWARNGTASGFRAAAAAPADKDLLRDAAAASDHLPVVCDTEGD